MSWWNPYTWIKKEPEWREDNEELFNQVMRNALIQAAYNGDAFKLEEEQPMTQTQATEVTTKKATIEQLPILVYRSVDTLNDKRKEIEGELISLKRQYELSRSELNDKLKLVKTSIRAWEAAKAVYDEDKEPQLDLETSNGQDAAPVKRPNRTRLKK